VRGVASAASGAQAVSGSIADLRQGADETGIASEEVLAVAREFTRGTDAPDRAVKGFLAEVKAASASKRSGFRRAQPLGGASGRSPDRSSPALLEEGLRRPKSPAPPTRTRASIIGRTSAAPRGPRPPRSAR
jgi:hypothetical protein